MKVHRVRTAKPIDGQTKRHYFVELEPDNWLEFENPEPSRYSLADIHAYIDFESRQACRPIRYAERAFWTGIIRDWQEEQPITE